jgi:group I intron endonuclease
MYIYKITNLTNGKIYIGQTVQKNPKVRWYSHLADAREGSKNYLHNAIRKYGADNFTWEVIDTAESIDNLNTKEAFWLAEYRKSHRVYNLREAGNNKTHSSDSIEKMRASQKLAHARRREMGTDTWKRRDGGAMKGKSHPKKGTSGLWKMSEEAKEKLRIIQLERSGTKGKTWKLIDGKRVYMEKDS